MGEAGWLNDEEKRTWHAFIGLNQELFGVLERRMVRHCGLSGADYRMLAPLSEAPEGEMRARDLGVSAGWDRSRVSHQLRRMEKRGLVARGECAEDARGSMVRLTDAGREAIEEAAPDHVEAVRRYFFDVLSKEEARVLTEGFGRALGKLRAEPE